MILGVLAQLFGRLCIPFFGRLFFASTIKVCHENENFAQLKLYYEIIMALHHIFDTGPPNIGYTTLFL